MQGKSCEEPSLDVVPATIELDPKNTRRKFAFRLVTGQGTSYLLQVSAHYRPVLTSGHSGYYRSVPTIG